MKTARLLITRECHRHCSYCSNNFKGIMKGAKYITDLRELAGYSEISITGGEPMLDPKRTLSIIQDLRHLFPPTVKLYLYTALLPSIVIFHKIVREVDGVQYAVHENSSEKDLDNFHWVQIVFRDYPQKSFRAYISPNLGDRWVHIIPSVWKRVIIQGPLSEKECKLPKNETLFILKERR